MIWMSEAQERTQLGEHGDRGNARDAAVRDIALVNSVRLATSCTRLLRGSRQWPICW
jgi:hypothetical protein